MVLCEDFHGEIRRLLTARPHFHGKGPLVPRPNSNSSNCSTLNAAQQMRKNGRGVDALGGVDGQGMIGGMTSAILPLKEPS